jgi:asparagine synthase (glutamine-hydrolysing)
LPPCVLGRPKIGFDIPIHAWFRGVLRPLLLETLSQDAVAATKLFHWPAVEHMIREHLEQQANLGYQLWGLVVLLMWMKQWKVEFAPMEAEAPTPVLEAIDSVGLLSPQPAWSSS